MGEVRLRYFGPEELEEGSTRALEQALERLLSVRVALRRERATAPLSASGEKRIVYRTCVR
ncbi:MAG TPA: hypothetical protein DFS52_28590 [Myxococcales bacterium]|nr:hypothetical protein [Myxococcales bacterium]